MSKFFLYLALGLLANVHSVFAAEMSETEKDRLASEYFSGQAGSIATSDFLSCSSGQYGNNEGFDLDPRVMLTADCSSNKAKVNWGDGQSARADDVCKKADASGKYSLQFVPDLSKAMTNGQVTLSQYAKGDQRYCLMSQSKAQCFTVPHSVIQNAIDGGQWSVFLELGDNKIPVELQVDHQAMNLRLPIIYGDKKEIEDRANDINAWFKHAQEDAKKNGTSYPDGYMKRIATKIRELTGGQTNADRESDTQQRAPYPVTALPLEDVSTQDAKNILKSNLEVRFRTTDKSDGQDLKLKTIAKNLDKCKAYVGNDSDLQQAYCVAANRLAVKCPYNVPNIPANNPDQTQSTNKGHTAH